MALIAPRNMLRCITLTYEYIYIELAIKWLPILSLGGIDKIRNHLIVNPIFTSTFIFAFTPNRAKFVNKFYNNDVRPCWRFHKECKDILGVVVANHWGH